MKSIDTKLTSIISARNKLTYTPMDIVDDITRSKMDDMFTNMNINHSVPTRVCDNLRERVFKLR